jgi:hypothetical protein
MPPAYLVGHLNAIWRCGARHETLLFSALTAVRFSTANDVLPKSLTASSIDHGGASILSATAC